MEVLVILAAVCSAISAVCGAVTVFFLTRKEAPEVVAEMEEEKSEVDLTEELMNLMRYSVGEKREER